MTNEDRARYGQQAVENGTPDYSQNDDHTNVVDTLANIMWHAHKLGIDFDAAIESAWLHFEGERDGDAFAQGD